MKELKWLAKEMPEGPEGLVPSSWTCSTAFSPFGQIKKESVALRQCPENKVRRSRWLLIRCRLVKWPSQQCFPHARHPWWFFFQKYIIHYNVLFGSADWSKSSNRQSIIVIKKVHETDRYHETNRRMILTHHRFVTRNVQNATAFGKATPIFAVLAEDHIIDTATILATDYSDCLTEIFRNRNYEHQNRNQLCWSLTQLTRNAGMSLRTKVRYGHQNLCMSIPTWFSFGKLGSQRLHAISRPIELKVLFSCNDA